MIAVQPAYSIGEWARACSVRECDVRQAISENHLILRRTETGRLVVTAEDGLDWLRNLAIESRSIVDTD